MNYDAVLLVGFGGPPHPSQVRAFIENVVRGRQVPPARVEKVVEQYMLVGGRSPYNEVTFRQARGIAARLAERGLPLPVHVGFRNWYPTFAQSLDVLVRKHANRVVGIVMAPHRSEDSWDRYLHEVEAARSLTPVRLPAVDFVEQWHTAEGFVRPLAERVRAATGYGPGRWPARSALVFTAHSIPTALAEQAGYADQIAASAVLVASLADAPAWEIAYQSRSGDPRTPWLEPDVNEVIERLASERFQEVVVVPIGFLCDNVEVLFDLDTQARATAERLGLRFVRPGTVEDHPEFLDFLASLVEKKARA